MISEIISSFITGAVALLTCILVNRKDKTIIEYKLEALTEEVRNLSNVNTKIAVVEEQIKVINHRIGDLENEREIKK